METQTQNAIIERTMLGFEDHGLLTIDLLFDYGGSHQGYGGYVLDGKPLEPHGGRVPTELPGVAIAGILRALDVDCWEKLVGQHVRVRHRDDDNWFSPVTHVGHFLKDQWFSFDEAFAAHAITAHAHTGGVEGAETRVAS